MKRCLVLFTLTVAPAISCSVDPEGAGFGGGGMPGGSATKADDVDDVGDADDLDGGLDEGDGYETEDGPSGEAVCGDGSRDADEPCDGLDFGDQRCVDFGFEAGALTCTDSCTISTEACHTCGDGTKQAAESCDGNDLGGESCSSQGHGNGTLACSGDCLSFDTSGCSLCGNGMIDPGEQCDGGNMNGQTCQSQGFDQGQLSCTASCTLNTAGCSNNQSCGAGGAICNTDADCCLGLCVFFLCA
jgi:hypothetical protein